MTKSLTKNKRFGNLRNIERGLNADRNAFRFNSVLEGKRVHNRRKHTHVIGGYPVHIRSLSTAPEVAAAYDNTHFYAFVMNLDYLIYDKIDGFGIDSHAFISGKSLAAYFKKYSLIHLILQKNGNTYAKRSVPVVKITVCWRSLRSLRQSSRSSFQDLRPSQNARI